MSNTHIELAVYADHARITINRPAKLNALTDEMLGMLEDHCNTIERNQKVRALVLTGSGERAFCAGGDIKAWSALEPTSFARHWVRDGHRALDRLARLSVPVIAVLNGDTLGGGLELAAAADYRIAESHITIGQPESGLGIVPGWSGTQRTVRRFGSSIVRRMALFGETFDAQQALQLGIVEQRVATGQGLAAADTLLATLIERSPSATELVKVLINAAEGEEQERPLDYLAGQIAAASEDLQTGLMAFENKQKPDFK